MSGSNYYPNYYSLEDIIVTQERVPCTVETRLPGMGKFSFFVAKNTALLIFFPGSLDPSCTEDDLEVGKSIEFPLWYAMQFDSSRIRQIK